MEDLTEPPRSCSPRLKLLCVPVLVDLLLDLSGRSLLQIGKVPMIVVFDIGCIVGFVSSLVCGSVDGREVDMLDLSTATFERKGQGRSEGHVVVRGRGDEDIEFVDS